MSSSAASPSSSRLPDTGPLLGSAYLTSQSLIPPASPSELNASLCLNISLFKNTLKKYRALDDAITTRLNRDQALHREQGGNSEEGQKRNCLRIWRDIIESWKRREAVIRYCVSSVDDRLAEREKELRNATSSSMRDYERLDANRKEREIRDDLYSEQTKRQQLHNELTVESIVRRRTLAAFFARCPNFEPPVDAGKDAVPVVDLAPMPMPRRPINF
ncbi:hypothetical protein P389DRAFT_57683 [Cystobasidium minutum MCA 4210]|uniref:uncharacterized protein n=1 Tax=Cystobasidium minutum MCA 4210 TaxID=1397322 RepID=UPI0034CF6E61|eukprot:jgi/Rhomi1/57683/CE57682_1199